MNEDNEVDHTEQLTRHERVVIVETLRFAALHYSNIYGVSDSRIVRKTVLLISNSLAGLAELVESEDPLALPLFEHVSKALAKDARRG